MEHAPSMSGSDAVGLSAQLSRERAVLSRWDIVALAFAIALTLLAFARVPSFDFAPLDDERQVTRNPHIWSLSVDSLLWMFTDSHWALRYTPLSWFTWALIHKCWGLNPAAFHVHALIVHVINTGLLYALIRSLLWRGCRSKPSAACLALSAAFGATVWGVHPLRVEVVCWITQVRFGEAMVFLLASCQCYLAATRSGGQPHRGWYLASVAASAVSSFYYPSAVGVPLLLLCLDVCPLRRLQPGCWSWHTLGRLLVEKLPFTMAPVVVGTVTIYARVHSHEIFRGPASIGEFGLIARGVQACYMTMCYLWKPFRPQHVLPIDTTLLYLTNRPSWFFIAISLAAVALTASAILSWWRYPLWTVVWIAHLAMVAPVAGFFEHPHFPADRYCYAEGAIWSIVAAAAIAWLWPRLRLLWRWSTMAVGLGLVVLLTGLANRATQPWQDSETLFLHVLAELGSDPYREDIDARLAYHYLMKGVGGATVAPGISEAYLNRALIYATRSLAVCQQDALAHYVKGTCLYLFGDFDNAQADLRVAMELPQQTMLLPKAKMLLMLADIAINAGEGARGGEYLDQAAQLASLAPAEWKIIGKERLRLGDAAGAGEAFASALRADRHDQTALDGQRTVQEIVTGRRNVGSASRPAAH